MKREQPPTSMHRKCLSPSNAENAPLCKRKNVFPMSLVQHVMLRFGTLPSTQHRRSLICKSNIARRSFRHSVVTKITPSPSYTASRSSETQPYCKPSDRLVERHKKPTMCLPAIYQNERRLPPSPFCKHCAPQVVPCCTRCVAVQVTRLKYVYVHSN